MQDLNIKLILENKKSLLRKNDYETYESLWLIYSRKNMHWTVKKRRLSLSFEITNCKGSRSGIKNSEHKNFSFDSDESFVDRNNFKSSQIILAEESVSNRLLCVLKWPNKFYLQFFWKSYVGKFLFILKRGFPLILSNALILANVI